MLKHPRIKVLVFTEDLVSDFIRHSRKLPKIFEKIREADLGLILITDDISSLVGKTKDKVNLPSKKLSLINLEFKKKREREKRDSAAWSQIVEMTSAKPSEIILFSNYKNDFFPARALGINFILVRRDKKNFSGGYPLINSLISLTAL